MVATSGAVGNLSPLPLDKTNRLENKFKQNKIKVTTIYAVVIGNLSLSRKFYHRSPTFARKSSTSFGAGGG